MDFKIEKRKFHSSISATDVSHVNIDKIVMFEDFPHTKKDSKYFVSYKIIKLHHCVSCYQKWAGM